MAAELNQPEPIIRRSLDKFVYGPAFSNDIVDALIGAEAFLKEQGLTRVNVDINRFVDRSLTTELGYK